MIIKVIRDKDNVIYPYDTIEDLRYSMGFKYFEIDRIMHDEAYRNNLGLSIEQIITESGNANQKKVRCIETGETYASPKECAESIGCTISSLSRVLSGKRSAIHGKHYEYIHTYLDMSENMPITGYENKYVFNLRTNNVFSIIKHDNGKVELKGVLKVDNTGREQNRVELWKNGKRKKITIEELQQCATKCGR